MSVLLMLYATEPTPPSTAAADHAPEGNADRIAGAAACAAAVAVPQELSERRDHAVADLLGSLTDSDINEVFGRAFAPLLSDGTEDTELFALATAAISGLDPAAPVGGRRLIADLTAQTDASGKARRALDAATDILKAKRPLQPFDPDKGPRSAKALLLFVLRTDPHDTVTWARDMPSDPLTVVLASALAGYRSGWTRLPVGLRGDPVRRNNVERRLADALAPDSPAIWSAALPPVTGEIAAPEPPPPAVEDDAPPPDDEPRSEPDRTADTDEDRPDGQLQLGVPEGDAPAEKSQETAELVRLLSLADLGDAEIARAAAAVCVRVGWEDLVTTVLDVGTRQFTWTGSTIEVAGVAAVSRAVSSEFVERLETWDKTPVPEMDALLKTLAGDRSGRRRRSVQ